jgi:hypothetical protein
MVPVGRPDRHRFGATPAAGRDRPARRGIVVAVFDHVTIRVSERAATAAGYHDNGAPGERAEHHPGYCGAYVLDPDGNNVEVVDHNRS